VSVELNRIRRKAMLSARSITHVILVIGISATFGLAQKQQVAGSNSKPEDQITQLERDWLAADAKGDGASLRRIISDDFIGSSFDGGLLGKEDIIPQGGGPGGFAGATPSETNVRVFGDTGVLLGVITTGGPETKQIRVTLVCQKRSQGWQMIAAHLTH
jgi:ketosteroid isomerase-like protein